MLRRVYHSRQEPPAGLNRVFYRNPEVDDADRPAALPAATTSGARCTGGRSSSSPRTCRTFRLWYKTNVAVFQRDIAGVTLSPIADFTFLKDVYREPRP